MSVIAHAPSNTLVIGEVSHYHFYQSMNQSPSRPSQKYQPTKTIIPSVPRQHCKAPVNSPLSFIRQQKLPQNTHPTATSSSPQGLSSANTKTTTTTSSSPLAAAVPASSSSFSNSAASSPPSQRPPIFTHSSADLLKNLPTFPKKHHHHHPLTIHRRPRKVSFDENVMVICTRFNDDSDDSDDDMEIDPTITTDQPEGTFLSTTTTQNTCSPPPPFYHGRRHSTGDHITDEQRQRKRWLTFVTTLKQWKYTMGPSSPTSPSIV